MSKVYMIGIGFRPLDKRCSGVVLNSRNIFASERLYDVFRRYEEFEQAKGRLRVLKTVDETITSMKSLIDRNEDVVLLTEGDPMFFGIGRKILDEFGSGVVESFPDLSSTQVAFSRIKETWDDAFLVSMHGGPDPHNRRKLEYELKDIGKLALAHDKIAVLTDRENTPAVVASVVLKSLELLESDPFRLVLYVCEKLGYPDERTVRGTAEEIAAMSFAHPNVLIIIRRNK